LARSHGFVYNKNNFFNNYALKTLAIFINSPIHNAKGTFFIQLKNRNKYI